jgi:hypothetical protein
MPVTDEAFTPEERAAFERQVRRKQFRRFAIFVVGVLGFLLAAVAAIKNWAGGGVGRY